MLHYILYGEEALTCMTLPTSVSAVSVWASRTPYGTDRLCKDKWASQETGEQTPASHIPRKTSPAGRYHQGCRKFRRASGTDCTGFHPSCPSVHIGRQCSYARQALTCRTLPPRVSTVSVWASKTTYRMRTIYSPPGGSAKGEVEFISTGM